MKVLVVGNGGREHVLCWKIAQSPRGEKIFCAPGNAGIAQVAECVNIPVGDLDGLAAFAVKTQIDLTIVGPEAPLCDGIVNVFHAAGLKIFGPDRASAQLEGSKIFSKNFMRRYSIPTAWAETFDAAAPAIDFVNRRFDAGDRGIVIKADGLAAGKGVIVALNRADAVDGINKCFDGAFGDAGQRILVEECLFGEETSILALTDGKTIMPLASSQDHKRVGDGDTGPNTGGMGAYSPAPVVTDAVLNTVLQQVLEPFLTGLKQEKLYFRGVLFVGVMVTDQGPKVLEFNVRFGDPEVQAVMMRLENDLGDVIEKIVDGRLNEVELKWAPGSSVCVVMASGGYPEHYAKGYEITGLKEAETEDAVVFHAGTAFKDGKIVNTGGRVLGVTARGPDVRTAIDKAYRAVAKIHWQDCFCRKDIGYRALQREK